jgi:hypothetical protein
MGTGNPRGRAETTLALSDQQHLMSVAAIKYDLRHESVGA